MWKPYRLRKTWDFQKIIEQKNKIINYQFLIFYLPNQIANCRFGITIPKKIVKKAVERNLYKRQIKNMLILWIKESGCLEIENFHYDLVIIMRNSYTDKDFQHNQKILVSSLNYIVKKEKNQNLKYG